MSENRRLALGKLLQAHVPADDREGDFVGSMMALLGSEGDPFSREHFVPGHFTASAFVLSPDRRDVLLIHHGKLHRWLQPGGHMEPGDADIVAAAKREVEEEVGIADVALPRGHTVFDVDVHDIPALGDDPPHQHFDVRILLQARSRSFQAGSDATAARWVPLGQVSEAESDASVMRAIAKLLAG